jgi:myo-inositol-1(or 4)-monophosphatase
MDGVLATPPSPGDLLAIAEGVAAEAADLLLARWPDVAVTATKSSATDVVTAMDTASEDLIRRRLLQHRPHDAVLGEERGAVAGVSTVRWIVDPLDGTVNYLYRLPGWAVSIAAEVSGEVVAGVVAVPTWGLVFTALAGGGSWAHGERLVVSDCSELGAALVATGFGYEPGRRAEQGPAVARLLPRVRDIRRFGAAATDLCLLASGRVDGYFERGLAEWDLAAGRLIAAEAGAVVEVRPDPIRGDLVLGAPPQLLPRFAGALEEVGA